MFSRLRTSTRLARAVAEHLAGRGHGRPEKGHQPHAAFLRGRGEELAPQRGLRALGDAAVVLVDQRRIGPAEHFLPAQAVDRNQNYITHGGRGGGRPRGGQEQDGEQGFHAVRKGSAIRLRARRGPQRKPRPGRKIPAGGPRADAVWQARLHGDRTFSPENSVRIRNCSPGRRRQSGSNRIPTP